jgi:copper chaperone CopZ
MVKKVFCVDGMDCPNCAMNIETIEDELPGIRLVLASFQKGMMEVEYDDTRVSEAQILAAVEQRGYHAKVKE